MHRYKEVLRRSGRIAAALAAVGIAQSLLSQTAAAQVYYEAIPLPRADSEMGNLAAEINEIGSIVGSVYRGSVTDRYAFLCSIPAGSTACALSDLGTLGGAYSF